MRWRLVVLVFTGSLMACARGPASDAGRGASSRDSLVAASVGFGELGPAGGGDAAGRGEGPAGFGAVRGEIAPAGVEAVIHVTAAGADTHATDPTFSDPLSGAFTAEELPPAVYRVEIEPLDPAYAPRVFEDVVVPYNEVHDLGTVDLSGDPIATPD